MAAYGPDLARSLNNLSIRLGEVGRRDEVLAASEEAAATSATATISGLPTRIDHSSADHNGSTFSGVLRGGGGICCCECPKTRLVPGPTGFYDSSGVTRNAQVRSWNLLPGSKKRWYRRGLRTSTPVQKDGRATYGPQAGSLSNTQDCRWGSMRSAPGVPGCDRSWVVPALRCRASTGRLRGLR